MNCLKNRMGFETLQSNSERQFALPKTIEAINSVYLTMAILSRVNMKERERDF